MVTFDHVGDVSPALLVMLAPQERVLVPIDSVCYRDPTVGVDRVKYTYPNPTSSMGFRNWSFFEALDGPGVATVATGVIGEIRLGELAAGQPMYVHDAALLAHQGTMQFRKTLLATYYLPQQTRRAAPEIGGGMLAAALLNDSALGAALGGGQGQGEPHYVMAGELLGPGKYAIQCHGNVLSFNLKDGEILRCHPDALVSMDHSVRYRVQVFGGLPAFPPDHYFPLMDLAGPGTVMVHSGRFEAGNAAEAGP